MFLRDSLLDDGTESYTAFGCSSPDIIIWADAAADASTFPDTGSYYGIYTIEVGNNNYLYLRVLNKTSAPVSGLKGKICYAPLATTLDPANWVTIAEDIIIPTVPAASGGVPGYAVSSVINWHPGASTVDPDSHYCLIGMFKKSADPSYPDEGVAVSDWTTFLTFVNSHNDVSYKNIDTQNIQTDTTSGSGFWWDRDFFIHHFLRLDDLKFDIETARIRWPIDGPDPSPELAGLMIGIHPDILKGGYKLANMSEVKGEIKDSLRWFQLSGKKPGIIQGVRFPSRKKYRCAVRYRARPKARFNEVDAVRVSQKRGKKIFGSANFIYRYIPLDKTKFIGVLPDHLIHKKGCACLKKVARGSMVPFMDLADARREGFDLALDCLNILFKPGDVSGRLQRRIFQFLNTVKSPEELQRRIMDTHGIGYTGERYGKTGIRGRGLTLPAAREIIKERDKLRGFKYLEQVAKIMGVGKDTFIDIVNSFKDGEQPVKVRKSSESGKELEPKKVVHPRKEAKSKKETKPTKVGASRKEVKQKNGLKPKKPGGEKKSGDAKRVVKPVKKK